MVTGSDMPSRVEHVFVCLFVSQEYWRRPDGMPATREHLMMVLADLDDILIRASYTSEMRSSSISDISMEVAVPNYSGLAQALEVEQCRCPPGYQGLSCQVSVHFLLLLVAWVKCSLMCITQCLVLGLCTWIYPHWRRFIPRSLWTLWM